MAYQNESITRRQADIVGEALLAAPAASQRAARDKIESTRAPKPASLFRSILRIVGVMFWIRSS